MEGSMGAYLFAHFKEKTTPDGEQLYFKTAQSACEYLHTYHRLLLDAIDGKYPICGGWIVKEGKQLDAPKVFIKS